MTTPDSKCPSGKRTPRARIPLASASRACYPLVVSYNPQYDYDYGPFGPLAALHERSTHPDYPAMIAPPYGWIWLVLTLHAELEAILPDYTIAQVKEKVGELRYYIDSYGVGDDDPRIDMARNLIAEAERASVRTCQMCGRPGRFQNSVWHATLCDEHAS